MARKSSKLNLERASGPIRGCKCLPELMPSHPSVLLDVAVLVAVWELLRHSHEFCGELVRVRARGHVVQACFSSDVDSIGILNWCE